MSDPVEANNELNALTNAQLSKSTHILPLLHAGILPAGASPYALCPPNGLLPIDEPSWVKRERMSQEFPSNPPANFSRVCHYFVSPLFLPLPVWLRNSSQHNNMRTLRNLARDLIEVRNRRYCLLLIAFLISSAWLLDLIIVSVGCEGLSSSQD